MLQWRQKLQASHARWRHQIETFSTLLAICAGNSPVPGEIPAQRPVTRSFDVFFDLRLNKRLSKQSWGWWFETLSCPLWRHRNGICTTLGLVPINPGAKVKTGCDFCAPGYFPSFFSDSENIFQWFLRHCFAIRSMAFVWQQCYCILL